MKLSLLSILLMAAFPLFAQGPVSAPCETNPAYAQFDFWLGEWEVRDTAGTLLGNNTITAVDNHCLLQEYWRSAGGGSGHSMNYYDPADSSWNQLWVSGNGTILKLRGGLAADGKTMVMRSEEYRHPSGQMAYHQISWSPQDENTVQQLWEIYSSEGQLLKTAFLGIYRRQKS